ncbi:MAG: hypothetical protein ACLR06_10735 [Christensenellaceae bacterium]
MGRHTGVNQSTLKKKGALIGDIVEILIGNVPLRRKTTAAHPSRIPLSILRYSTNSMRSSLFIFRA